MNTMPKDVKDDLAFECKRNLQVMEDEAVRMINSSNEQEVRAAWYHSHLGSIDFARQMKLIDEDEQQKLYWRFSGRVRLDSRTRGKA